MSDKPAKPSLLAPAPYRISEFEIRTGGRDREVMTSADRMKTKAYREAPKPRPKKVTQMMWVLVDEEEFYGLDVIPDLMRYKPDAIGRWKPRRVRVTIEPVGGGK